MENTTLTSVWRASQWLSNIWEGVEKWLAMKWMRIPYDSAPWWLWAERVKSNNRQLTCRTGWVVDCSLVRHSTRDVNPPIAAWRSLFTTFNRCRTRVSAFSFATILVMLSCSRVSAITRWSVVEAMGATECNSFRRDSRSHRCHASKIDMWDPGVPSRSRFSRISSRSAPLSRLSAWTLSIPCEIYGYPEPWWTVSRCKLD